MIPKYSIPSNIILYFVQLIKHHSNYQINNYKCITIKTVAHFTLPSLQLRYNNCIINSRV